VDVAVAGVADKSFTAPEEEYLLLPFDQISVDMNHYADLAVLFGYMTLFIAALPAAPLLTLLCVCVKAKSDAYIYFTVIVAEPFDHSISVVIITPIYLI
jgi:hypothetical protein